MDLCEEKTGTIFYLKFLQAILVTNDLTQLLQLADDLGIDYSSPELLKMLKQIIEAYTENNSLPDNITDNIYRFLNVCRFMPDDEYKQERISFCNEIIVCINSSHSNKPYPIYENMINEYYKSFIERVKYHAQYVLEPDAIKGLISAIAELEYLVIYFHSSVVPDEEFVQDFGEELILSLVYLLANDHLIDENPSLLRDKMYLSRLSFILKNNEQLLSEYQGNPDEDCFFELAPQDEEMIKNKQFWKLQEKIKKKVKKAQKDS